MKSTLFLIASCLWSAMAFSVNDRTSRRDWFKTASLVVTSSIIVAPELAHADITNKIASSSALRYVKRSAKQLDTLELLVSNSDYAGIRAAIRTSPLAEIRKNMIILTRGGEDGPEAQNLNGTYQTFITNLEAFDLSCNLGIRGRKIPEGQLYEEYNGAVAALKEFMVVADSAVKIPLQTEESQ